MSSATACYADHAASVTCRVVQNIQLAERTYRLRVYAPAIARQIVPGQFVMVRLAGASDPLLARPFALYDVAADESGEPAYLDVVYLVLGKMTSRLANVVAGDEVTAWGPLGNGFPQLDVEHLIMVAGGIGQTPFVAVGGEFLGRRSYGRTAAAPGTQRATLCYGVRTAALAAGVDDFRAAGIDVRLSSDDGSIGHHGLVTDVLRQVLAEDANRSRAVFCCGPERMMHAVADLCAQQGVTCHVSLETPMACGLGICFSCVVPVRDSEDAWDFRRTCIEGPVFDAATIAWEVIG